MITMEHGRAEETSRDRATSDLEAALGELIRIGKSWNKTLAGRFNGRLSPLEFGVLRYVLRHAPVRSASIVSSFELDKASVSRAIKVLRDQGLIESTPDPTDGRASILTPTDRALTDFERYRDETRQRYRALLDEWSEDDLSDLARLLTQLVETLPPHSTPGQTPSGQ